jgi:release factor glutamine methyltransferase
VTGLAVAPEASAPPARWTVLEVVRWTVARFTERDLATPRLDAELLVAHALGLPRLQLYVQFDRPLLPDELAAIRALIKRRQAGESVAYLVGKKEFWGLEFAVDARVLVPRPDTETLIEVARERLAGDRVPEVGDRVGVAGLDPAEPAPGGSGNPPRVPEVVEAPAAVPAPRVADVGTGSGAIALTLAKLFPAAAVFAVDISPGALEVARGNAERLGLAVTFVEGDLGAPLAAHGPFSLLAANLPYIPSGELATLPAEVRVEPALALDGGPDGLALVRRFVAEAPALLGRAGVLALEIGAGQALATAELLRAAGFTDVQTRRDLGGVERVVSGVKA